MVFFLRMINLNENKNTIFCKAKQINYKKKVRQFHDRSKSFITLLKLLSRLTFFGLNPIFTQKLNILG